LWPLTRPLQQSWLSLLFEGRYLVSLWPYFTLLPRLVSFLLPTTAFKRLPTETWCTLQRRICGTDHVLTLSTATVIRSAALLIFTLAAVLCLRSAMNYDALVRTGGNGFLVNVEALFLRVQAQQNMTCYVGFLMLPAISLLMPVRPSFVSALGERTFMGLFVHFCIVCGPLFDVRWISQLFGYNCDAWRGKAWSGDISQHQQPTSTELRLCLPPSASLSAPYNYSPEMQPFAFSVFYCLLAFVIQVVSSFHMILYRPAWWPGAPSWLRLPYADYPKPRVAIGAWLLLILLGVIRVSNETNLAELIRNNQYFRNPGGAATLLISTTKANAARESAFDAGASAAAVKQMLAPAAAHNYVSPVWFRSSAENGTTYSFPPELQGTERSAAVSTDRAKANAPSSPTSADAKPQPHATITPSSPTSTDEEPDLPAMAMLPMHDPSASGRPSIRPTVLVNDMPLHVRRNRYGKKVPNDDRRSGLPWLHPR